MGQLADDLKKYLQNPDELDKLTEIIQRVAQFEEDHAAQLQAHTQMEEDYQNRFAAMQKTNRELVRQIPINNTNPNEPEEDKLPSWKELAKQLADEAFGRQGD